MVQADSVAKTVLDWFSINVPGKKHALNEYSVLAAFVVSNGDDIKVLSVGTGTKCLGRSSLCNDGYLIHDAHAEVTCRRAFLRYLYLNLHYNQQEESIFQKLPNGKFTLKPACQLFLYVSEAPCGDAALYDIKSDVLDDIHQQKLKRRKLNDQEVITIPCRTTGAKIAGVCEHSHERGLARVKSGRSDLPPDKRTLSMSCSDKICKWLYCGLQGNLLSKWYSQINLSGIVVSVDTTSNSESFLDSIKKSLSRCEGTNILVSTSQLSFPLTKSLDTSTKTSASGISLNWTYLHPTWKDPTSSPFYSSRDIEYLVGARGVKMGSKKVVDLKTKQKMGSRLARRKLYEAARSCSKSSELVASMTYQEFKAHQKDYVDKLANFKELAPFKSWQGVPVQTKSFT
ncbi:hypothetical protein THRCLA_23097, partial [Thraustotheca clavata]